VPEGPPALSSDGLRYAYVDGDRTTSKVHLVDLKSGTDRVVSTGGPWQLAALAPDFVYATQVEYVDSAAYGTLAVGKGLWRVALDGTSYAQLTSDARAWSWFADDAVYGGGSTADVAGGPNDIVRYEVPTYRVTTWFSHKVRSRLLAVDGTGAALILTEADHEELWRARSWNDATKVWSGPADAFVPTGPVAVDGSDVWLSSSSLPRSWAIFHFSPGSGLKEVARFTDRPVTVAGPCA
jgi:hypothetical protein